MCDRRAMALPLCRVPGRQVGGLGQGINIIIAGHDRMAATGLFNSAYIIWLLSERIWQAESCGCAALEVSSYLANRVT